MGSRSVLGSFIGSLKRIVAARKLPEICVGQDEFGNKYYKRDGDPSSNVKELRRIVPPFKDEYRVPQVSVEWMTWLQNRRLHPPTEEELNKNFVMQEKTKMRAQELENNRVMEEGEQVPTPSKKLSDFPSYDDYEKVPGQFKNKQ